MPFSTPPAVDFNYFLNQKYALLRQQADAGTSGASSQAIIANAQAGTLGTEADLNKVRANLAPAESRAQIGLQGAQANLANQSASVVVPEATARIGQIGAETGLVNTQNKVLTRNSLDLLPGIGGASSPLGAGYSGYRLPITSETVSANRTATPTDPIAGETSTQRIARLRALGY